MTINEAFQLAALSSDPETSVFRVRDNEYHYSIGVDCLLLMSHPPHTHKQTAYLTLSDLIADDWAVQS